MEKQEQEQKSLERAAVAETGAETSVPVSVTDALNQIFKILAQVQTRQVDLHTKQVEMWEYLADVSRAQNLVGVMQLTVMSLLKEKGVLLKSEVKKALDVNMKLALDEVGNFKLNNLLDLMPED